MSNVPATAGLRWVRGSTIEDVFTYLDPDNRPVDLTGFEARMHVRTIEGQYGLSTTDTLVMELSTEGGQLDIDIPETGVTALRIEADDTVVLNPLNEKKVKLCYSMELFQPADGATPEYVIPLVQGTIVVFGETTR